MYPSRFHNALGLSRQILPFKQSFEQVSDLGTNIMSISRRFCHPGKIYSPSDLQVCAKSDRPVSRFSPVAQGRGLDAEAHFAATSPHNFVQSALVKANRTTSNSPISSHQWKLILGSDGRLTGQMVYFVSSASTTRRKCRKSPRRGRKSLKICSLSILKPAPTKADLSGAREPLKTTYQVRPEIALQQLTY